MWTIQHVKPCTSNFFDKLRKLLTIIISRNYWKKTIPTFLPCGSGRMKELLQRVVCLNSLKPPMLVLLGERKNLKCNVSDLLMRQILSKSNKLWLQPCFCRLWKYSIRKSCKFCWKELFLLLRKCVHVASLVFYFY